MRSRSTWTTTTAKLSSSTVVPPQRRVEEGLPIHGHNPHRRPSSRENFLSSRAAARRMSLLPSAFACTVRQWRMRSFTRAYEDVIGRCAGEDLPIASMDVPVLLEKSPPSPNCQPVARSKKIG